MATTRLPRSLPWLLGGLVVAAAGAVWIARDDMARQREAFDTDARIAHRLLSQRVVQHDAILSTLALLQAGDVEGNAAQAPEQRLPAVYAQVLKVFKRDRETQWPEAAWRTAEAQSREQHRAALAEVDFEHGRYTLVRAAEPASYALQIDIDRMVPWDEWPMRRDGPVRLVLQQAGQTHTLQAGRPEDPPGTAAATGMWHFDFSKHLAAESQPFDMVATRAVGWHELPWGATGAWLFAVVGVMLAAAALWRQREARRRAEALLRLDQVGRLNALGELAAGMAHELNQPLTALLANTQAASRLLAEDPPELLTARRAMDQAVQQARRASEVVGRLRQVVQRPETSMPTQVLALADVVRKVLYLLEPESTRRGVVLHVNEPASAMRVRADPVALEQIVHNLVMNALQALERVPPSERELAIDIAADQQTAVLSVSDTGPGMAPEALPRVFEPFFTTRSDGLGLGLSLCETLASGMGGALTGGNRAPRGAQFRLTLPLATFTAEAAR